ncbi:MAG: glycoside hydrolase family 15 protein [Candidatus Erginobacter occultus]|nr:glycoside hydrolase family 15 protein [Candidatus Erginobacter occultus]
MPRDIPVGNGRLLIAFDHDYRIRDFYYPRVGQENHLVGHRFRFGFRVNGNFLWVEDLQKKRLAYLDDSLVTDVELEDPGLGIAVRCRDCVDFYETIYFRKLTVKNLAPVRAEMEIFFNHDFHISGNEVGDTAAYRPRNRTLVHYKGPRYFLINISRAGRAGIEEYSTGKKEHAGLKGTWVQAERGRLDRNPISQGSVDSTAAVRLELEPGGEETVYYWIVCGTSFAEVDAKNRMVEEKGPELFLRRTFDYWRLWSGKEPLDFGPLPAPARNLYRKSLLILRTQIDAGGAVIAANDSDILGMARDTYSYMWPRDGALVAAALDQAGYHEISRRFFNFCLGVIEPEGYFLHKYNPDGTLASSWHPWLGEKEEELPIQEDETALVIWALLRHYRKYRDLEFITPFYKKLIKAGADFMADYRDPATGLPLPSWDLWEERRGILTFTAAAVHAGLSAAAEFAGLFGETGLSEKYLRAAGEIKAGMERHLFDRETGRFLRMIRLDPGGAREVDRTVDASLFAVFYFGVFPPGDPRVTGTMEAVREELRCRTEIGGVARYPGDAYQRVVSDDPKIPGNPWFICTMWLAQWEIARARSREELEKGWELLEWVVNRALPSGVLAEQVDPRTGEPVSVSPLTWSHATFVAAVQEYLARLEEFSICPVCGHPSYRRLKTGREPVSPGEAEI